jgi:hypothetical protein
MTTGGFCTKVWNDQKAMKPRVLSSCLFSLQYETTPRIPSLKNGIKQGPCMKSPQHIQKQLFALKFA